MTDEEKDKRRRMAAEKRFLNRLTRASEYREWRRLTSELANLQNLVAARRRELSVFTEVRDTMIRYSMIVSLLETHRGDHRFYLCVQDVVDSIEPLGKTFPP
jgi:hypothetical protein